MLCFATEFLELGTRITLKVTTEASFRGKKNSGNLDF